MTMIALTTNPVRSRSLPGWSDLKSLFVKWQQHIRSRTELLAMNDRELRDIRWSRMEANTEINKPFWRP